MFIKKRTLFNSLESSVSLLVKNCVLNSLPIFHGIDIKLTYAPVKSNVYDLLFVRAVLGVPEYCIFKILTYL